MKRICIAKFESDDFEWGATAIRVVDFSDVAECLDGINWCEEYNKTHDKKIEKAKFIPIEHLQDHWYEIN